MKIELDDLSYKHRFNASSMLTSKAHSLADAARVTAEERKKNRRYIAPFDGRAAYVDVDLLGAAIAYYDMALLLMRPNDPNWSTVANWKCNALISLGQYEDALRWYAHIVKASAAADGPHAPSNATVELAKKQIASYRGRKNEPVDYRGEDSADFKDPPFCMYARDFVEALATGRNAEAVKHIEPDKRKEYSTAKLKTSWKQLVGRAGPDTLSISLESYAFDWKGRQGTEMGWCYFSVTGSDVHEGIAIVVSGAEHGGIAITRVEFGRP